MSEAIAKGDVNAINYFVAQKYVEAFAEAGAQPAAEDGHRAGRHGGITGSIAGIGELVKTRSWRPSVRPAAAPVPRAARPLTGKT